MDDLREILREKLTEDPGNSSIAVALSALDNLVRIHGNGPESDAKNVNMKIISLLRTLINQGILGNSEKERNVLLKWNESTSSKQTGAIDEKPSTFTTVTHPSPSRSPVGLPWQRGGFIMDSETLSQLEEAQYLHTLCTAPERVIPPGKSLRAVLSEPKAAQALDDKTTRKADDKQVHPALQETIEKIAHKAFWDEALEVLKNGSPAVQLARIRRLYLDLHAALTGLLPSSHPSMVTLSSPLSPTSAPLVSTVRHLKELATSLKEICAPVRDDAIDAINTAMDSSLPSQTSNNLPLKIINAIRDLLHLADSMKSDLASVALTFTSDEALTFEITQIARQSERNIIFKIYGVSAVHNEWLSWLGSVNDAQSGKESTMRWISRLIQVLGDGVAVSCPFPAKYRLPEPESNNDQLQAGMIANSLPPSLLFSTSRLLHFQNHLQALTIAATLRTLVPHAPNGLTRESSPKLQVPTGENDKRDAIDLRDHQRSFTERVLALLMIEIDESSLDSGTTKLVNLADEVVHEYSRVSSSNSSQFSASPSEQTIRSAVDTLLQPTNAVFILLRKRLVDAISDYLSSTFQRNDQVPFTMQTGRDRKRPKLDSDSTSSKAIPFVIDRSAKLELQVKGYEDPTLRKGINAALKEIIAILDWIQKTWPDLTGS